MKVLKKAKDREDLMLEVTCYGCGALLGVTPGDVRMRRDGDGYFFDCPECGHTASVKPWWREAEHGSARRGSCRP